MWWKWTLFILGGICILACVGDTTYNWIKGNTGPFGPKPEDWWGCGVFTIIVGLGMFWLAKQIFKF